MTRRIQTGSTLTRRGFARALAGGSFVAGTSWVRRMRAEDRTLRELGGALRTDETTLREYARDSGQIVHELPCAVLRPRSVDDIVATVRYASKHRLGIAARGAGHQPYGQAQVEDGIVIDMRSLNRVHDVTEAGDAIEVDAGADWSQVLTAALTRERTPPVLTNYLGLTVGGTLGIGGIGITTHQHGAQVDNVLELEVVTGEGRVVLCSERKHRRLFEAALAGQGQCGIVTRAVLRLVPAPPMLREYTLPYPNAPALLEDQRTVLRDRRFDGAVALMAPQPEGWLFLLQGVRWFSPPDPPDDAALTRGLSHQRQAARIRDVGFAEHAREQPNVSTHGSRPSLGLMLPGAAADGFMAEMLPRLHADDLGGAGGMRVFLWNRSVFTRPLFRVPDAPTCMYIAMLREDSTDPEAVARMLTGNRALFERARELGGTVYPFCALELTRGDWRTHYRESWSALETAKRTYDPGNVFASGPNLTRPTRRT